MFYYSLDYWVQVEQMSQTIIRFQNKWYYIFWNLTMHTGGPLYMWIWPDTKFELHKKEPTKLELQKNEPSKLELHKFEPIKKRTLWFWA